MTAARAWRSAKAPAAALAACLTTSSPAWAIELSASGFATIGYAVSDQPYTYQRFIDNRGTFRRDSIAGLQVDARFANGLGATVQVKAAPATANDRQFEGSVSWAFLSYRPDNDWLLRVGKQRIPLYLYSENYDVGATYDFARLPYEMYSIAPSNDALDVSISKTWRGPYGETSLDGYAGQSENDYRLWFREGIPGVQSAGAQFIGLKFKGGGLVLTHRWEEQAVRLGWHRAAVSRRDGQPLVTSFAFVPLFPGVGYYQVDPSLPGPGVPTAPSVTNTTFTFGAELKLPGNFRFLGEFARSVVSESDAAPQGNRGYVTLSRRFGNWTPYATYAFLRSPDRVRNFYNAVNGNTVPPFIPGAAQINASQRAGAEQISAFDQHSWVIGTSYTFSATSKLKTEIMRTHIGDVSTLVDAPPNSTVRHQNINVLSLSYSVVF